MSERVRMVDDDPNEPENVIAEISLALKCDVEDRSTFMTVVSPNFYSDMEELIQKYQLEVSAYSVDMFNKSDLKDATTS